MLAKPYTFRPLRIEDATALAEAYHRNAAHLGPWEPRRSPEFYTAAGQVEVITSLLVAHERGTFHGWVLWYGDEVAGRATLQNIVRGAMQGGTVGYWIDRDHLRRGLATAAVEHLAEQGLQLGLHRLEAGTMVANVASQGVLRRAGFTEYGLVPQFLYLDGAWRDHVLFQRILHDGPPRPLTTPTAPGVTTGG